MGITVNARSITEAVVIASVRVTVWGVPADPSHDAVRGKCLGEEESTREQAEDGSPHNEEKSVRPQPQFEAPGALPVEPFLTNPTSCGEAREAKLSIDGWNNPGNFTTGENIISLGSSLPPLTGCEKLDFSPSLKVTPDGSAGSTPTGLNVGVRVAQESTTNPAGLGEADIRDTTVTLPAGMQVSPSAANGLQACSNAQIGFLGVNARTGVDEFTDRPPGCPDASKIANVRIATPLLEHELTGAVYLAAPQNFTGVPENPFLLLAAMYLVAEEPATGVLVKLPGQVELGEPGVSNGLGARGRSGRRFRTRRSFRSATWSLNSLGTDRAPGWRLRRCAGRMKRSRRSCRGRVRRRWIRSLSFQITSGPGGGAVRGPVAVRAVADGRLDEYPGWGVQPVGDDDLPRRWPAGHPVGAAASPRGSVRHPERCEALC